MNVLKARKERYWIRYQLLASIILAAWWIYILTVAVDSSNKLAFAMSESSPKKLVVATRLHLGSAEEPPDTAKTESQVLGFSKLVASLTSFSSKQAVIAVDLETKFEGFDYVAALRQACEKIDDNPPHILPVTPWGKFVPALNALVAFAAAKESDLILFVSAETTATAAAIESLCQHATPDDTLVAGTLLGGHEYRDNTNTAPIELTGRTTPWNTMALWKVSKLALTGFQLVSDGVLTDDKTEPSYGVEEVMAIALLQKVLGPDHAKAKLIKLAGVEWNQTFQDEDRRQWHETKMKSKIDRADRQLKLAGLSGEVYHC